MLLLTILEVTYGDLNSEAVSLFFFVYSNLLSLDMEQGRKYGYGDDGIHYLVVIDLERHVC